MIQYKPINLLIINSKMSRCEINSHRNDDVCMFSDAHLYSLQCQPIMHLIVKCCPSRSRGMLSLTEFQTPHHGMK